MFACLPASGGLQIGHWPPSQRVISFVSNHAYPGQSAGKFERGVKVFRGFCVACGEGFQIGHRPPSPASGAYHFPCACLVMIMAHILLDIVDDELRV